MGIYYCSNCGCDLEFGNFNKCSNCVCEHQKTIKKLKIKKAQEKKTKKISRLKRIVKSFNFKVYMGRPKMFGDKQKSIKELSTIKLKTLEKNYSNLDSFISREANDMREEINRLRIVVG